MGARLRRRASPKGDVRVFSPAPHKGNLVARLRLRRAQAQSCWSPPRRRAPTARTGRSIRSSSPAGRPLRPRRSTTTNTWLLPSSQFDPLRKGYKPDRDIIVAGDQ